MSKISEQTRIAKIRSDIKQSYNIGFNINDFLKKSVVSQIHVNDIFKTGTKVFTTKCKSCKFKSLMISHMTQTIFIDEQVEVQCIGQIVKKFFDLKDYDEEGHLVVKSRNTKFGYLMEGWSQEDIPRPSDQNYVMEYKKAMEK